MEKIKVKNTEVEIFSKEKQDYISITDIARYKNQRYPKDVVKNWLRLKDTIDFLTLWEEINNPSFKGVEFDPFKNDIGKNSFVLSPSKWIKTVNATGLISKAGKYGGGTFAHKDIAFEFASWISPEFKLYLIKEFQRLKEEESRKNSLDWSLTRTLAKINYKIHTDSIKENLVPKLLTRTQQKFVYANEADVLNMALFGMTAKEWQIKNPSKKGNIRDYADIRQLICLSNLGSLNAELIRDGLNQEKRLIKLNMTALFQMRALTGVEDPFCPLCALL